MEAWKTIEDFDNYHEVSSLGNLRCTKKGVTRSVKQYLKSRGGGYLYVSLYRHGHGGKGEKFYVHRLVASAFCQKPLGKDVVNHIDGNSRNNQAENLAWCTQAENVHHALDTGLCRPSKLSPEQVMSVRSLRATSRHTFAALGQLYNVDESTIRRAVKGTSWAYKI